MDRYLWAARRSRAPNVRVRIDRNRNPTQELHDFVPDCHPLSA